MIDLKSFLNDLRNGERGGHDLNESAVCQAIIMPILSNLDWDIYDANQVIPEYSCGEGKIDYCLKAQYNKVFLEAKKANEELMSHQKQLLRYAFEEGANLAVLTNGYSWWFYLPLLGGNWEERRFLSLEIDNNEQSIEFLNEKFKKFLGFNNVKSGNALEDAKTFYNSKENERKIEVTIPKAWEKLLKEKNNELISLVSRKVKELKSLEPTDDQIIDYLISITNAGSGTEIITGNDSSTGEGGSSKTKENIFYCDTGARGGAKATAEFTENYVTIFKGSTMTKGEANAISESGQRTRERLIRNNVVKLENGNYKFIKDYKDNMSPSAAAQIILGRSANGWTEWRTEDGVYLKDARPDLYKSD